MLYISGEAFNVMVGLRDRIYGLLHEGQRFGHAGVTVGSTLQLDDQLGLHFLQVIET
jgi:hypothetical protein